jgi:hypothetical protein
MRKVKFTQDSFDEKLDAILTEFPILDVSRTQFSYKCSYPEPVIGITSLYGFSYERAV